MAVRRKTPRAKRKPYAPVRRAAQTVELGERVLTGDGSYTMAHPQHGETYHSKVGALNEAQKLYIEASGFLEALQAASSPLRVLDVGLGLGYNALSTIEAWRNADAPPDLFLASIEVQRDLVEALASGNAPWQENWAVIWISWCQALMKQTSKGWHATLMHPSQKAMCVWTVDVVDALKNPIPEVGGDGWQGWTHIWQDPFSPEINPDMWDSVWFQRVAKSAAPKAVLMSYSVSRIVKDALSQAGWQWEKLPGSACKRSWLKALREK